MVALSKIARIEGKWTCVFPIANLVITRDIRSECRLIRVNLVAADVLARRGRRLGLPKAVIAPEHEAYAHFRGLARSFAIVRLTGKPEELEARAAAIVREELALLTISQLTFTKRAHLARPSIADEYPPQKRSCLFVEPTVRAWFQPNHVVGHYSRELILNREWREYQANIPFFARLLRVARNEGKQSRAWCTEIVRAAALFGNSLGTTVIADAFLLNMIAIELLLTHSGDTYSVALPQRAEALLGWVKGWTGGQIGPRLQDAYRKRCTIVHEGKRGVVDLRDLYFTDDLLLNLLYNILRHESLFRTKEDLEAFSERVRAEQLLGVRPKVRPKTMHFFAWRYVDRDFDAQLI